MLFAIIVITGLMVVMVSVTDTMELTMLIRIITGKVSVVSIMIGFFLYILLTLQMIRGKCVKCLLTTM